MLVILTIQLKHKEERRRLNQNTENVLQSNECLICLDMGLKKYFVMNG